VNVLALDLGTRTGWALSMHGRIESGVQVFDVKRGESPGMRYVRFNRWVESEITIGALPRVSLVVYEQTHNRGGAATEVAAGFATRVQEFCARHGIEHAAVHSATLKKFTTGSGRGDKDNMREAAMLKGWLAPGERAAWDDNEIDAICLLHYALSEIVPSAARPV
jgi:crossover junction endodeoxyribonuclease RuvC